MSCESCGRPAEGGLPVHWIGCTEAPGRHDPLRAAVLVKLDESEKANRCTKDGCTNPRAASKGPRPTKYCDEHKTRSKR